MNEHQSLILKYLQDFHNKIGVQNFILPTQTNYYAVMVELRNVENLNKIILNHLYFLNHQSEIKWGVQLFHGENNEDYVKHVTKDIKNIIYKKIDTDNITKKEYSDYVKSLDFWNNVDGEKILIFQSDSLLLRHGIEEFLEYDYIGAPWSKPKENSFIGNGGLSLRTKKVMVELIKKHPTKQFIYEDIFYGKYHDQYNCPDIETAMKFSVEDVFYPTPLGIHNPIKLTTHQLSFILEKSLEIL